MYKSSQIPGCFQQMCITETWVLHMFSTKLQNTLTAFHYIPRAGFREGAFALLPLTFTNTTHTVGTVTHCPPYGDPLPSLNPDSLTLPHPSSIF